MAVDGTEEGLPVRRLLRQEAQDPLGRNPSPQTRGLHNSSPGSGGGKHHGPPPTPPARKTDASENPRPPGFEIPFWIFGQSPTFSSIFGCFSVFGLLSPTDMQVNKNGWVGSIGTPAAQRWIFLKKELFCKPHVSTKRVARPHLWISQVVSVLFSQLGKAVGQEEEKEVNIEPTKKSAAFWNQKTKRWREIISFPVLHLFLKGPGSSQFWPRGKVEENRTSSFWIN